MLWRSWAKEERISWAKRGHSRSALILFLIVILVGIEAVRRIQLTKGRSVTNQAIALKKLEAEFRDAQRIASDWGWWDDSYAFIEGKNPSFPSQNLATSSLFDQGAAMAIYDTQAQRRALQVGLTSPNRPPDQRLVRCLDSTARTRRQLGLAGIRVICSDETNNLYVGFATPIGTSDNSHSTTATLIFLNPLVEPQFGTHLKEELNLIQAQLQPIPPAGVIATGEPLAALKPKTFGENGRLMGVKPANSQAEQRRELNDLLLLLTGGGLIALALRLSWKLAERRQRLLLRQKERWATQRIRRSHRALIEILDFKAPQSVPSPDHSPASQPIEGSTTTGSEPAGHQRVDIQLIANRFEQILGTARDLAMHDALTGLANRRYCIEHLEREIDRLKEEQTLLVLLFIDLDKFKSINDTYGHRIGDQALRKVANQLKALCLQGDFLARYGSDEFILILNPADTQNASYEDLALHAKQVAHRIFESFEKSQVDSASPYRLSLSIGITISDPHHFSSEDIIRKADLAMYKAKTSQGEHIHLFTAENESNPLSDYRLFTALQQACEASLEPSRPDSFRILFQPIVNAAGEVLAVEALARWDHPDLGEVPPTLFIPVAEHYRIMGRVGWQLIEATLKTFKQLIQALKISPNQLDLAINISPSQLTNASFSGQLIDAIAAQGISCNSINLEITETAIFNSTAAVEINLRNCREAGMRISLDDFGTGFSSMGLLLSLKPDELKIDRSFVIGVLNDSYAEQIVDLLPRLTNSVSMTLVAEGVDTEENFQRLQQMGVARFQGYLFSEPLNIAALVELVGGNRLTIQLPAA
ncbi:MAG: EAL domain-containing protein [Cyanobium usitatum Tobar12.5m-G36]|nr:EAL domain-containing protein [Cyanobium usitatum Tobar12.5m-G36]